MNNGISVVEEEVLLPYLVKYFTLNVVGIDLNVSATIITNTYDAKHTFLFTKSFIIEGQEYLDWGSNDDYLKSLIASKLGLVIEPVPEPIIEPIHSIEVLSADPISILIEPAIRPV